MNERIPVLVTGAGSELALGIIKACRLSRIPLHVVGCDAEPDALGLHWADVARVIPRADHEPEAYIEALRGIIAEEGIRAIFPTPDVELPLLADLRDEFLARLDCWIMINRPREMARFDDKWQAYEWYVEHDLPTPLTTRADRPDELERFLSEVGFPIVLKPRRGGGSRTMFMVNDRDELQRYLPLVPNPIAQAYVGRDDEEYTAGTFRTVDNRVHTIVLRRTLKFGMTYKAEVVPDRRLHNACRDIIHGTQLEGVNNIQFRCTPDGPEILEINARFSGTAGIRAHFGFNEPEMVTRQYVLHQQVEAPIIESGRVMRYLHEQYLPARAPQDALAQAPAEAVL